MPAAPSPSGGVGDVEVADAVDVSLEAVAFLLRHRISGAPVVASSGKLVGVLTRIDIIDHVARVTGQP